MIVSRRTPATKTADVLGKAFLRAASSLGLSQRDMAAVLGISEASASRMARARSLDPQGKPGELALLFVRVWRSLDALVGGDAERARRWLHAGNRAVSGVPAERIRSVAGLVHVAEYLDAMRGKL